MESIERSVIFSEYWPTFHFLLLHTRLLARQLEIERKKDGKRRRGEEGEGERRERSRASSLRQRRISLSRSFSSSCKTSLPPSGTIGPNHHQLVILDCLLAFHSRIPKSHELTAVRQRHRLHFSHLCWPDMTFLVPWIPPWHAGVPAAEPGRALPCPALPAAAGMAGRLSRPNPRARPAV